MQNNKGSSTGHCYGQSHSDAPSCAPSFQLFDAHCHLQDERFANILDAALKRAKGNSITSMMCCGSQEDDWQKVQALSKRDGVMVSFGLHPWYVMRRTTEWFETLKTYLDSHSHAGVGEIGLDNAIKGSDPAVQEEVFVRQLRLARELHRPVSIHCRGAFGRMAELLEKEGGVEHGGLVHSYSGSSELVPVMERLGLCCSFSGTITRPRNKRARAAITAVTKNRLLIETDSPDMPPAGAPEGVANEPANLIIVLETVAALIGLSKEETAELTRENAQRLFGVFESDQ